MATTKVLKEEEQYDIKISKKQGFARVLVETAGANRATWRSDAKANKAAKKEHEREEAMAELHKQQKAEREDLRGMRELNKLKGYRKERD